jgi:hypothetical protein
MLRSFIGSIIFEAIGAFIRWLYLLIRGKNVDFSEVWKGRESMDLQESTGYGFSNIILGIGFIFLIILILKLIGV